MPAPIYLHTRKLCHYLEVETAQGTKDPKKVGSQITDHSSSTCQKRTLMFEDSNSLLNSLKSENVLLNPRNLHRNLSFSVIPPVHLSRSGLGPPPMPTIKNSARKDVTFLDFVGNAEKTPARMAAGPCKMAIRSSHRPTSPSKIGKKFVQKESIIMFKGGRKAK